MKQFVLLLIGACLACTIHSQEATRDKIPESVKAETMSKLAVYAPKLAELREWLRLRNGESATRTATSHGLFRWPMRVNSNYDDMPDYYTISNYMDINRNSPSSSAQDWYCNTGFALNYKGHEGNDYSLYPFYWRMMDNKNAFACAAADGIVLNVRDSVTNDDNCMRDDSENNTQNYISILNRDSSISRYMHIKTGSALVKEGQFVQEGQLLAHIASSGHSSNPHLHFDLQYFHFTNGQYDFVEPFKQNPDNGFNNPNYLCNPSTETTWWKDQKTFIDPKLERIMTHSGTPVLRGFVNSSYNNISSCPETENVKAKNQFNAGDLVVVGVALSHVSYHDSVHLRITYPNGNAWISNAVPVPDDNGSPMVGFYPTLYLTRNFILPSNAPDGTYTIETTFIYRPYDPTSNYVYLPQTSPVTKTYKSYFTVGCIPSLTLSNTVNTENGFIVSNDLNSTQVVSGKALYQSANYIQLNPGFEAKQGCTLKARIRSCSFSD